MDTICKIPGLSHISEDIFKILDKESLLDCRMVNKSWREVLDQPKFWLKKMYLEKFSKSFILKITVNHSSMLLLYLKSSNLFVDMEFHNVTCSYCSSIAIRGRRCNIKFECCLSKPYCPGFYCSCGDCEFYRENFCEDCKAVRLHLIEFKKIKKLKSNPKVTRIKDVLIFWKEISKEINDHQLEKEFVIVLIKICNSKGLGPLDVAIELAESKKYSNVVNFIIENSDPHSTVELPRYSRRKFRRPPLNLTPLELRKKLNL